jgi:hypothetical protein
MFLIWVHFSIYSSRQSFKIWTILTISEYQVELFFQYDYFSGFECKILTQWAFLLPHLGGGCHCSKFFWSEYILGYIPPGNPSKFGQFWQFQNIRLNYFFSMITCGSRGLFWNFWNLSPFIGPSNVQTIEKCLNCQILFKGKKLHKDMTWIMSQLSCCLNDQALTLEITL